MDAAPQPRSIQINGAELTYVEQGAGDAVVFVHGALGDYRDWLALFPSFVARYRVIAYSRRRHWPNAWPDDASGTDAQVHAVDLAALIAALGLAPAHLVGHSYGAVTALLLAAQQPELARTLILGEPPLMSWLDSLPDGPPLLQDFLATAWNPSRDAFQRGELEPGARAFINGVMGAGVYDRIPPDIQAAIMDNAPEMRLHIATPTETIWPPFFCADAMQVRTPTLLLSGESSPLLFHRITDELARCLPAAERATIPGVSHDLENPPVFTETALGFLAKH